MGAISVSPLFQILTVSMRIGLSWSYDSNERVIIPGQKLLWRPEPPSGTFEYSNTSNSAFLRAIGNMLNSEDGLQAITKCCSSEESQLSRRAAKDHLATDSSCLYDGDAMMKFARELVLEIINGERGAAFLDLWMRSPQASINPILVLDMTLWSMGVMRSLLESHYSGDQFGFGSPTVLNNLIKPTVYLTPSPISNTSLSTGQLQGPGSVILAGVCSKMHKTDYRPPESEFFLKDSPVNARRQLLASSIGSGSDDVVVGSFRFYDGLAWRVMEGEDSGRSISQEGEGQWENKAAQDAAKQIGHGPGPLFPRTHLMMFYRLDWFEALQLQLPATWDELIHLGEALFEMDSFGIIMDGRRRDPSSAQLQVGSLGKRGNFFGRDMEYWPDPKSTSAEPQEVLQHWPVLNSSDVEIRLPICLDLSSFCKGPAIFNAIMASVSQSFGIQQGAFADPDSGSLLATEHPVLMAEVVRLYAALANVSALPFSMASCSAINHLFATGNCLITIDWDINLQDVYNSPLRNSWTSPGGTARDYNNSLHPAASAMVGNVGVSPLPGAMRVYERASRSLRECSRALCPLGRSEDVMTYERSHSVEERTAVLPDQLGSVGAMTWQQAGVSARKQGARRVNRAPFSVFVGLVDELCVSLNPSTNTTGK